MYGYGYGYAYSQRRRRSAPLDAFATQLYAAVGSKLLLSTYTGPCLRVRRSSDNAELDIGFAGGLLDVTALLAFVGSASGYVAVWYDQTGNDHDATQATAAQQPRIVINGDLNTGPKGGPCLRFQSTALSVSSIGNFARNVDGLTLAAVAEPTLALSRRQMIYASGSIYNQERAALTASPEAGRMDMRRTEGGTVATAERSALAGWHRYIGRARFVDGLSDVTIDGMTTDSSPISVGPSADTAGVYVLIGANGDNAMRLEGNLATAVLMQSSADIESLDAALAQVMP